MSHFKGNHQPRLHWNKATTSPPLTLLKYHWQSPTLFRGLSDAHYLWTSDLLTVDGEMFRPPVPTQTDCQMNICLKSEICYSQMQWSLKHFRNIYVTVPAGCSVNKKCFINVKCYNIIKHFYHICAFNCWKNILIRKLFVTIITNPLFPFFFFFRNWGQEYGCCIV